MSGISAFPEGSDVSRLQTGGFDKARGAGDFVGQGGTHKNRILKFVVRSLGLFCSQERRRCSGYPLRDVGVNVLIVTRSCRPVTYASVSN